MSGQTWTPAPKKGAIPLHPMTFGMVLGRAFAALRHNPKVLFGFAIVVEFIVTLATVGVLILMVWFIAVRIQSVPPSSPDYWPILIGSTALGGLAAVVMGLASVAFTSVVQGLVAADVSFATVSRKASLRLLWSRVKPAFWRLFSYSLLQGLAALLWVALLFGVVGGVLAALGPDNGGAIALAVILGLLLGLGSIPLYVWLTTKLLVVPAVLVLERATIRSAVVRSWRLIRGRFWFAFGVMFVIGAIMGIAVQVVAMPASLFSGIIGGILSPTGGGDETTAMIAVVLANVIPQVLVLAVQAIALVVTGTGGTLIYIDSRMRYEGLDQALIRYVELSAQGTPDDQLGDPFAVDPERAVSKNPPPVQKPAYAAYPGQYPSPGQYPYPAQAYPAQGYPAPPAYGAQPSYGQPAYGAQPAYPQAPYGAQPGYPATAAHPGGAQVPYTAPGGAQVPSSAPASPYAAPPAPPASGQQSPAYDPPAPQPPHVIPPSSASPWAPPGGDA